MHGINNMNNSENRILYESAEVIAKYAANTTRLRSLNNAEKFFIDRYDIKNKRVLVIGCGTGRVPANLLLYGNTVVGVDRSKGMLTAAQSAFPQSDFPRLSFIEAEATDLSCLPNTSFDVVLFAMNSIDYIETYELRECAIREVAQKIASKGILAFTSHNKIAYFLSPKIRNRDRTVHAFFDNYKYMQESVVGGGVIFKGNPKFIITETEKICGFEFLGYTCDARNKMDRVLMRHLSVAQFIFPYLLYVFKNKF